MIGEGNGDSTRLDARARHDDPSWQQWRTGVVSFWG